MHVKFFQIFLSIVKTSSIFCAVLLFASCSERYDRVEVNIKVPEWGNSFAFYNFHSNANQTLFDSVRINSSGEGIIKLKTSLPSVIALSNDKKVFPIVLVVKPGDRISISSTNGSWEVSGSQESMKLMKFQNRVVNSDKLLKKLRNNYAKCDSLEIKDSLYKNYLSARDSILNVLKQDALRMVSSTPYNISAIFLITARIENRQILPYNDYKELYRKVDTSLSHYYSDNSLYQSFKKIIKQFQLTDSLRKIESRLLVGNSIPQQSFISIKGENISLPGIWARWILLDFWGAGSKLNNNLQKKELKRLFEKHKKNGLAVVSFGVGLDSAQITQMTQRDTLSWYQVSLATQSDINKLKEYGVVELPTYILTNRYGTVIAKAKDIDVIDSKIDSMLHVYKRWLLARQKADTLNRADTFKTK